jgi:hypothetical protein
MLGDTKSYQGIFEACNLEASTCEAWEQHTSCMRLAAWDCVRPTAKSMITKQQHLRKDNYDD